MLSGKEIRNKIIDSLHGEIDAPLETAERFTIIATVADWIDSGKAAQDLLVKIEEKKSDLAQTPEIPKK